MGPGVAPGPDSVTHRRLIWRWAFIARLGISLAEYDGLALDEFETGISYLTQLQQAAQPP